MKKKYILGVLLILVILLVFGLIFCWYCESFRDTKEKQESPMLDTSVTEKLSATEDSEENDIPDVIETIFADTESEGTESIETKPEDTDTPETKPLATEPSATDSLATDPPEDDVFMGEVDTPIG